RNSSAKDETRGSLVLHAIEQVEPMYVFGSGIPLPLASLPDGRFVQLPVVVPDHLDQIPRALRTSERMSTDTACIDHMRFLQLVLNTELFRDVAIRQMHLWKPFFGLFVHAPPHNAHLGGIPKPWGLALNFLLLVGAMN